MNYLHFSCRIKLCVNCIIVGKGYMNFELFLVIIQTITGIYFGYKSLKLNNQEQIIIQNNYIKQRNDIYIERTSKSKSEILEEKERYLKYFHWIFNIAFFGTGLYTLVKMFPSMLKQIKIFDNGITLTNLTKLLTFSFQNALLGSLIINIIGGLLLIIFTITKPYYDKRRIPLSIIIVLTNFLIFIDLFTNKYHSNIVNSFHGNDYLINFLTILFIFITMMLVLANNMILGIYLFDLKSYKNQFKDPIIRFITIIITIIIYAFSKWLAFYNGLEVVQEYLKNYFN